LKRDAAPSACSTRFQIDYSLQKAIHFQLVIFVENTSAAVRNTTHIRRLQPIPPYQQATEGWNWLEEEMVRLLVLFVISGAAAPILIAGAIPSLIVVMAAPPAIIYAFAFVALTPMCGLLVSRLLPLDRNAQALGELINFLASARHSTLMARAARQANRLTSLSSGWR
jgi:hypothetical protein